MVTKIRTFFLRHTTPAKTFAFKVLSSECVDESISKRSNLNGAMHEKGSIETGEGFQKFFVRNLLFIRPKP